MSTRRVRRSASDAVGRSWHGPPQAALAEAGGQPLQRPAQLLPAGGLRLEGRQLAAGRIGQSVEDQADGRRPAAPPPLPAGGHGPPAPGGPSSSRAIQSGSRAGAGKASSTPRAGASSSCRRRAARPGARWRARSTSHSSAQARRRARAMAPTPSSGGSKTIERLRRAGRRRGASGRGSSPRASSCSRSPATPNWAPTAERGSVASCPMAVSPNSAKRWRVAGSAGSRSKRQRRQLPARQRPEGGRGIGPLGVRQPRGQHRQPAVLPRPDAHRQRAHLPAQRHRPRRDAALLAEQRPQAGDVDQRHSHRHRLDPRGEVVEAVQHRLPGRRLRLRQAQVGPDQGQQPRHAPTNCSAGSSCVDPRGRCALASGRGRGAQQGIGPPALGEIEVELRAAAGQRPALARDGGLHPLPHQVAAHRQPGLPLQRHPHAGHPAGRLAAGPGQQQRHATRPHQQVGQAIQPARQEGIGQVQHHRVDPALAGQPAGQLHRLGGIGRADDQQPGQVDAEPGRGGRVQAASRIQVGDQAAGRPGRRPASRAPGWWRRCRWAHRSAPARRAASRPCPGRGRGPAGRSAGRVAAGIGPEGSTPRRRPCWRSASRSSGRGWTGRGRSGWTIMAQPMIEQMF